MQSVCNFKCISIHVLNVTIECCSQVLEKEKLLMTDIIFFRSCAIHPVQLVLVTNMRRRYLTANQERIFQISNSQRNGIPRLKALDRIQRVRILHVSMTLECSFQLCIRTDLVRDRMGICDRIVLIIVHVSIGIHYLRM